MIAGGLAFLILLEGWTLLGVPQQARQWRWRQWIAAVLLLAGIGSLAVTGMFSMLYPVLRSHPLTGCNRRMPGIAIPCDLWPDAATRQALEVFSRFAIPSVMWLLATYVLALVGLVGLGVGSRRRRVETLPTG